MSETPQPVLMYRALLATRVQTGVTYFHPLPRAAVSPGGEATTGEEMNEFLERAIPALGLENQVFSSAEMTIAFRASDSPLAEEDFRG